jgi:hypothetical protein
LAGGGGAPAWIAAFASSALLSGGKNVSLLRCFLVFCRRVVRRRHGRFRCCDVRIVWKRGKGVKQGFDGVPYNEISLALPKHDATGSGIASLHRALRDKPVEMA